MAACFFLFVFFLFILSQLPTFKDVAGMHFYTLFFLDTSFLSLLFFLFFIFSSIIMPTWFLLFFFLSLLPLFLFIVRPRSFECMYIFSPLLEYDIVIYV